MSEPTEGPTAQPLPAMPVARMRTPREMALPQLLDRLATTAAERAAAASDTGEQRKLERVTQLARELAGALSDVEVIRDRGPEVS